MEYRELLQARHSCRAYTDEPVSDAAIERLYEAVKVAPSACNRQPWKFLIVRDPVKKHAIAAATKWSFLEQAPVLIAALGHEGACWKRPEGTSILMLDIGIAMEHLVLAATDCGLGTCWVCAYEMAAVNAAVGVSAPWSVYALSPLGHPASALLEASHKERFEVFEVIG